MKIDPLDINRLGYRLLTDRGITAAMDAGLIKTTPDFRKNSKNKRIQPASLDVEIHSIDEIGPVYSGAPYGFAKDADTTLQSGQISTVKLTELIDFGQFNNLPQSRFLKISTDGRSSIRRWGGFSVNHGGYFFSDQYNTHIEVGNIGPNHIEFERGERISQILWHVYPFKDKEYQYHDMPEYGEMGELVRTFDMGIEIRNNEELEQLHKQEDLVLNPEPVFKDGLLLLHASDIAHRMKKVGTLKFNERKNYSEEDLFSTEKINKGLEVNPYEHIMLETVESFMLSDKIGIRFWDNPLFASFKFPSYKHMEHNVNTMKNAHLTDIPDAWVDPNYKGMFTRQPKWLDKRVIHAGDVVGFGQVFYFPNGVGIGYGDSKLGSQYQKTKKITASK